MRVHLIVNAIEALNAACAALRSGSESVHRQMEIGNNCARASIALSVALEKEQEIPIQQEAA